MRFKISEDGCWNWTGQISTKGYGVTKRTTAHRASYDLFVGPVLSGQEVHHRCGNRRCVNPEHLELLPVAEHRKAHAGLRGTCAHDHPWTLENTYIRSNGQRQCRACKAAVQLKRYHRLRAQQLERT